eukprot:5335265-Prymnesium_polylepis.1
MHVTSRTAHARPARAVLFNPSLRRRRARGARRPLGQARERAPYPAAAAPPRAPLAAALGLARAPAEGGERARGRL